MIYNGVMDYHKWVRICTILCKLELKRPWDGKDIWRIWKEHLDSGRGA